VVDCIPSTWEAKTGGREFKGFKAIVTKERVVASSNVTEDEFCSFGVSSPITDSLRTQKSLATHLKFHGLLRHSAQEFIKFEKPLPGSRRTKSAILLSFSCLRNMFYTHYK
jgi:hypothetical protein